MADKSRKKAMGVLEDCLVRVGELMVPVDFLVLDLESRDDKDEEPYLLMGRPFMDTTNMEINMRDETIRMTVRGKTLRLEISDDSSPPLHTSKFSPNYYDEVVMKRALDGMRTVRTMALHTEVQGKDGEKREIPRNTLIPGMLSKAPKHLGSKKEDFSVNFLQLCSSNFDETEYPKCKGEKLDETLGGEKRKRKDLRNSEYEGTNTSHLNFEDDPSMAAGPNDAGNSTDQHVENPP